MPRKSRKKGAVELPKHVHRVVSRAREYFYYQVGRGTANEGPRTRLPDDPHDPAFWIAIREAQGAVEADPVMTFGDVCDLYETSPHFAKLGDGTKDQYRRGLKHARNAWAKLAADQLRPVYVRTLLDELAETPGTANTVLGVLRALSAWGCARDHFPHSITHGVKPYAKDGGHKPWTDAQLAAAEEHLTGMARRGFFLARYTGQRGSDVVRLGETFIDEGGFHLVQQKTRAEVWCPIEPELAAEMAKWDRAPGPYLRQESGKPYSRKLLDRHFAEQRDKTPALAGVTLHGLRSTRVVELKRRGSTTSQIEAQVGMSLAMIDRYSRFADKKADGKAAVVSLEERRRNKPV